MEGFQVNKKIAIIMSYLVLISNYAAGSSKYAKADYYLKNNDYEMAAQQYLRILGGKGPAALSKDTRAMTGAFISLYHLQQYKKSFSYCKRVLKLDTYNSCAIFYAGQNLEALGKINEARKLYKYYTILSRSEPYRPFIMARYYDLYKKMIKKKVKSAIQLEQRIRMPQISDHTVAVLYFVNESVDHTWDVFSKGFTKLLNHDLSQIKDIKLIDRLELQMLLDKLQFNQSELIDENLIPRFGRLLKARYIINGSFRIDDSVISLNVGLLDVKHPNVIEYTEFNGKLNDIFKLEKSILLKVLEEMDVFVSHGERKALIKYQTKNINGFLAYCNGLDAYDLGNYDVAYNQFTLAADHDSRFVLAKDMQQTIDGMILLEQGDLTMNHFQIIGKKSIMAASSAGSSDFSSATRARLEHISLNLDLGYMPGNDSRNGTSNIDFSNIHLGGVMLPEPPPPPGN
jgi:TolB-like protein